jgi:hypothetical protein
VFYACIIERYMKGRCANSKTLQKLEQSDLLDLGFVVITRNGEERVKAELNSWKIFKSDQASDPLILPIV